MDWRLRRAEAGDAAAAALVASASFLTGFYDDLSGADIVAHCARNSSADKFADWIGADEAVVTLAEFAATGAPIGYTVLCPPDLPVMPEAADIELKRIYTLPCGYGTGLAAALLERAVADARELRAARLLLGVYGENHRALRFYRKHGFADVGTRRFLVGESWHDDLILARRL